VTIIAAAATEAVGRIELWTCPEEASTVPARVCDPLKCKRCPVVDDSATGVDEVFQAVKDTMMYRGG